MIIKSDCGIGTASLPKVYADIQFEHAKDNSGMLLVVSTPEDGRYMFWRTDKKWRWLRGPFVSKHDIAAKIFAYRENPSELEMDFMGGFIDSIGQLLDATEAVIDCGVKEKTARRQLFHPTMITWPSALDQAEEQQNSATFVYMMRHANGLTKIGRSKNPKARENTLQAEDPRLQIVFQKQCDGHIETRLHGIFDSVRVRGEWFCLQPRHVDWIAAILTHMK